MDGLLTILIGLVSLCIGVFAGYLFNKKITEAKIGKTDEKVEQLIREAEQKAALAEGPVRRLVSQYP